MKEFENCTSDPNLFASDPNLFVTNDPKFQAVDRLTNPDGITVNAQAPLIGSGVSLTLTRNFDVVPAFSQERNFLDFKNLATAKSLSDLINVKSLLGGVSVQASVITESDVSHKSRLEFYTNGSVNIGGCARICAGASFSPQSDGSFRRSLNLGLSPGASGGVNVNYAPPSLVFNPHRAIFGPTYQTR